MKNCISSTFIFITLISTICLSSCMNNSSSNDKDEQIPEIRTETVVRTDLEYTATQRVAVKARNTTDLYFNGVSGLLSELHVTSYDFVKKGDLLAELDTAETLERIRVSEMERQVWEIKKQQQELDEAMAEQSLVTAKNEYDANPQASEAANKYKYAQLNKDLLGLNRRIFDNEYQNFLKTYEQVQQGLENCKLTADDDGIIVSISALDKGDYVDLVTPIFKFVKSSDILLFITSEDAVYLKQQDSVDVVFDGLLYKAYTYTPKRSDGIWVDDGSIHQLYLAFHDAVPEVKPGNNITISMSIKKPGTLAIPKRCIRNIDGVTTVNVLSEGQYTNVPVRLGIVSGSLVEILSGLSEGDIVLAE